VAYHEFIDQLNGVKNIDSTKTTIGDIKITVGDKELDNLQKIALFMLKEEIKIKDVLHKGKKCNATVKIISGQLEKKYNELTSEKQKKFKRTSTLDSPKKRSTKRFRP
jgi:hypothetical protein